MRAAGLFPFAEAMQFGFGVLKLAPDAFWALTPRELEAAVAAHGAGARAVPLDRASLSNLMERYPDHDGTD